MKIATLALSILAGFGAMHATAQAASPIQTSALPDCFDSNHDAQRDLFTIRGNVPDAVVNQQCLLHVGPRSNAAAGSRLAAGNYLIYLSNGGGGGAGGTIQGPNGGGGAGGGGAGARETQTRVYLAEGTYKLTIGTGGPGGRACVGAPFNIGGGPGWLGSPSSFARSSTNDVLAGAPGADSYVRPTRAQLDKLAGPRDGHGGSGPGQTSGGRGGKDDPTGPIVLAQAGQGSTTDSIVLGEVIQSRAPSRDPTTTGGGGGASSRASGGGGGGEAPGQFNRPPQTGSLGSGGGGGEGGRFECDAGARGGHGFIALRRN